MIGIIQRAPTGRGASGFGADSLAGVMDKSSDGRRYGKVAAASSCENRDIPYLEAASPILPVLRSFTVIPGPVFPRL